ncbi:MAG: phosphoglucosamine mutase, partial [Vulcanimicrobiaceae bacterium]
MARLFGTDGVRGVANADLTPELALRVSRAGAQVIARDIDPALPIVVGRDTRLSSPMLEAAVVAGVASAGRGVLTIGIVPTPGVACIVTAIDAAAGVMISASHNPIEDNGIKFFGPDGFKLADDVEREIEALLDDDLTERPTHADVGSIRSAVGLVDRYATRLIEAGGDLSGLTVVVDAAYGAAYRVAPRVLERLGARVVALHDEPDGARINVNCGATDLRALAARVRALSAAEPAAQVVGVAFDGDADRALFVDERGNALSGDNVMLILGRELHAEG